MTGIVSKLLHADRLPIKDDTPMREVKLQDLKQKSPTELLSFAEELEVENASSMRKQELMFAILKQLANNEVEIIGEGVVEVLQDGFSVGSQYAFGMKLHPVYGELPVTHGHDNAVISFCGNLQAVG